MEVVVTVWEPRSSLWGIRSGTTVQVHIYLVTIMDVLVYGSTIWPSGKDGTRKSGGDAPTYHKAHYDGDRDDGDYEERDDTCEEPHVYLLAGPRFWIYPNPRLSLFAPGFRGWTTWLAAASVLVVLA